MKLRLRLRRRTLEFAVVQGAIEVEYIELVFRSRRCVVLEIGTKQKYAEVVAYSGADLLLGSSEDTRKDTYDAEAPLSVVMFPVRLRDWSVLPEMRGRYSLRVALYRSGRGKRSRSGNLLRIITEEERIARVTEGSGG